MINLHHIDCMEFMRGLPDKAYALAIVDPPYGIGDFQTTGDANTYKLAQESKYGDVKKWNMSTPDQSYFLELRRVSKNQIIWGANYYNCFPSIGGCIVWDKNNESSQRYSNCEIASCSLQKKVSIFRYTWNGMIQQDMSHKEARIHSCQKPVALYKWLLQNYAQPGDNILDTHLGSGSIAIACHDLGYSLYGCEIDADYYRDAVARYNRHAAQIQMFNGDLPNVDKPQPSQERLSL